MAIVQHEISINRTPDEVWAVLGEFGGLDTWMDGVESCVVTGKTREIEIAGGMNHRATKIFVSYQPHIGAPGMFLT